MSEGGGVVFVGLHADPDDRVSVSACVRRLVVSIRVRRCFSDCDGVVAFSAYVLSDGNGIFVCGPSVLSDDDFVVFGFIFGAIFIVGGSRNGFFPDGDGAFRESPRTVSECDDFVVRGSCASFGAFRFVCSADGDRFASEGLCARAERRGTGVRCSGPSADGGGADFPGGGGSTDVGCVFNRGSCELSDRGCIFRGGLRFLSKGRGVASERE